jgi:PhoPQ-activated pathogenicity-related protein
MRAQACRPHARSIRGMRVNAFLPFFLPGIVEAKPSQEWLESEPDLEMLFLGTNDAFWTVDSLNLYWDELAGGKFVVYVPNADHDLATDRRRVMGGLRALHRHAHGIEPLPAIRWTYAAGADVRPVTLEVDAGRAGARAVLWTAEAPTRDFRNAKWTSAPLTVTAANDTVARVDPPPGGYRAMFVEVVYADGLMPLHLSTTIRVLRGAGE